jgi:hypothetical protein
MKYNIGQSKDNIIGSCVWEYGEINYGGMLVIVITDERYWKVDNMIGIDKCLAICEAYTSFMGLEKWE